MMMMSQNMSSMHNNNNTNNNNTPVDSSVSAFALLSTLSAATLPVNNCSNSTLNNNDANNLSNSANSSSSSNASNSNAYNNSSDSLESLALNNSSSNYLADSTSSFDSQIDESLDGTSSFKPLDAAQKQSKTTKKHCKNPSQKSKKHQSPRKPLGSSSGSEATSGEYKGAPSVDQEGSSGKGNASNKRASPYQDNATNSLHDLSGLASEKPGSSSLSSSSSSSPTQSGKEYSITSGEQYYSYQNYRYRYQAKSSEILGSSSTRCVKQASTLFAAAPSSDSFSFSGWHRNRFNSNNNNNNNNNTNNNNGNHHDRQHNHHRHHQTSNPLCCMERNQQELRSAVREILSMSPIVGVYQDENQQQWKEFVAGLLEYFEGRADGPRAMAAAKMRADTAAAAASATEVHGDSELKVLLGTLGLELGKSSLKEISQKCDVLLASSSAKRDLESSLSLLKKNENNLRELQQEGSRVRQAIIGGLMKKHTKIETSIRITKIIEDRIQENQELEEKIERLRENLEKDERARRVERIRELLGTSLAMWKESDKQAGRDTQESGRIFESEVLSDQSGCIDVILKRLGMIRENIAIHRGCSWENADGEVDIVLTDAKETKIVGIAEVKARVYDISAAYRQSGPHRSSSKNRILINGKALVAPRDPSAFFVLTTLPKNQFALPFESKLKDSLNKYFLNTQPADVDYDTVRLQLAPLYSTMISPLAWFDNFGESALIVAGNTQGQQCTYECCSCQPCQSGESAGDIVKAGRHQQDTDTDTDYDCDDSRESDCDDLRDRSLRSSHSRGSLHSVLSSSGFSNSITQEDDELEEYSEREPEEEEREEESEGEEDECLVQKRNRFLLETTPINEQLPNFKLFSLVQENKTTRTSVNTRTTTTTTTTTTTPTQPQPHPQPQPQNQLKQQQQQQLQQQQQKQQQQQQQQQQQHLTESSVSQSQNNLHLHGKLLLPLHGGLLGGLPLGGLPLLGGVTPVNFSEQVSHVVNVVVDPVVVVKVNQQENEETLKKIKEGKGGKKGGKGGKKGSSSNSSGSRPTQDIKKFARKPTKCEELKRGSRSSLPSAESVLSSVAVQSNQSFVNVSMITESSPIEGNSESSSSSSDIESSSESSSSSSAGESGDMEGSKYVSSIQAISQEAKLFEACSSDSSRPVKVEDSFESLANQTLKIHLITPIPQPQC